ncbi:PAS domain-containing protein, partial [Magnetovibrio blakemorei]|uniref:PAS domain-containing protein n=1 Tax=Magnetovibrio blakemorei TaxID=28181 RepID=UPI001112FE06
MSEALPSRSPHVFRGTTPLAPRPNITLQDDTLQDDLLQDLSRQVASSVLDAVSDLVCICIGGKIKHINKAGVQFLEARDASVLIGQSFQAFISDNFAATIDNIIGLLAKEPEPTPMRIKGLNGKLVSLRLKVVALPELGETAHMVLGENITRQAELTDAIQLSETRFRNLVNNALDLICVMDDGRISYINSAGLKMLKAAHKEF